MSAVVTRLATRDDLADVATLFDQYRQFYQQPADPGLAVGFMGRRMQNRDSVILLADVGTTPAIGFCQLYPALCSVLAAPTFVLYDLFVLPSARRLGAARALMLAARAHAESNGAARLELSTARTNLPAQSLYESLGWVRDENFFVYTLRLQGRGVIAK